MTNTEWNIASNTQIKEELSFLEQTFKEKQEEIKRLFEKIDGINSEMIELSQKYNDIKAILNKREGKTT